jgi:hypothetical protein
MPALMRAPALLVLSIAIGFLVLHALRYWEFRSDDTLISLRYAERLLQGQGLTWNDGERVEGYSNLLWILATALLGVLGIDLLDATRVLGLLGMGSAIAALVWLHGPRGFDAMLPALAGGLAMALTGSFAVWTPGGLEQPMVVGLVAWAFVLLARPVESIGSEDVRPRALLAPGLLLALLCWTRPDGPLFAASACGVLLIAGRMRGSAWRAALWLAALPALFVALQLAFRLAYYDAWLPNTAHSKLAFTSHRLSDGVAYLWGGLLPLLGLVIPAGGMLVLATGRSRLRPRALLWLSPLVVWSGWVVMIGGDIFPGRRHLVVVVLLLALMAADLWQSLSDGAQGRRMGATWAAAVASLLILGGMQWGSDRTHLRALDEIDWARRGESLGRVLGSAFSGEQPLLAATAAGALPYYSKLPALDMLGLNDRYLALHPPDDMGEGRIAHELGDGAYFLHRAPDLVVFCGTRGAERACSRGGREMQADSRFESEYRLVTFFGTTPIRVRGKVWVREGSERIGIRVTSDGRRIELPAYLFSDQRGALASLNARGELGVQVEPGRPARFEGLVLDAGVWQLELEGDGDVRIASSSGSLQADRSADSRRVLLTLSGDAPTPVTLWLEATAPGGHVTQIRLTRQADATVPPMGDSSKAAPPAM